MKHLTQICLAIALILCGSQAALAHRPYFTQIEKIRLPNGEMGEARLLNGDGILGPDPVRVVVVDAQSRLLARSRKSGSMALVCREEGPCFIFDFSAGKILDLVPASFRQGPYVPGPSDNERNNLWDLEDGSESWGFVHRDPSFGEMALSYKMLVLGNWPMLSFNIVIGVMCALLLAGAMIIVKAAIIAIREKRNQYFRVFMTSLAILIVAAMGLFIALVSGFFSLMGGLTFWPWFASLCFGGVLALVCFRIRKRSQARVGLK